MSRSTGLPFFPAPYPDETLHSLISRYHVLSANRVAGTTLTRLLGEPHSIPSAALPSKLGAFERAIAGLHVDGSPIVDTLTVYPYFRPFLDVGVAQRIEQVMQGSDGSALGLLSGRGRAGVPMPSRQRYCPKCVRDDRSDYGVAYWHRAHQLPGVLVCHRHPEAWLRPFEPGGFETLRHASYLPPAVSDSEALECEPPPPPELVVLARLSHELLQAALPVLGWQRISDTYRHRLLELGLITASGRVRQREVHALFHQRYRDLFQDVPFRRLKCTPDSVGDWLASIFRQPRRGKHPIKHLLVIGWLFGDFKRFQDAVRTGRALPEWAPLRQERLPRGLPIEQDLRKLLLEDGLSILAAAQRLGIAVTTATCHAQSMGIPVKRRRKTTTPDMDERIRACLLEGMSSAAVAARIGVSVPTVDRVARTTRGLRERIREVRESRERARHRSRVKAFLRKRPGVGIEAFRRSCRADYAWCRRHDWHWFRDQFPAHSGSRGGPPECDWNSRDQALAQLVRKEAKALLEALTPPSRLSRALLLRQVGATDLFPKHRSDLPLSEQVLRECVESVEQARIRRVQKAALKLRERGEPVVEWRIKRLAGLKVKTSAVVNAAIARAIRGARDCGARAAPVTRFVGNRRRPRAVGDQQPRRRFQP